jgi:hypothetical protein
MTSQSFRFRCFVREATPDYSLFNLATKLSLAEIDELRAWTTVTGITSCEEFLSEQGEVPEL